MAQTFVELKDMFSRTKSAINEFMAILTPTIENAKDEHERLYYHHIYEEEEQRLDRLQELIPKLDFFISHEKNWDTNDFHFVQMLQDVSLEKFGLHNFLEHLDLALFSFRDTEHESTLQRLRGFTSNDYQRIKEILTGLNDRFDGVAQSAGSTPTDEKEDVDDNLKVDLHTEEKEITKRSPQTKTPAQKGLTVGSLKP